MQNKDPEGSVSEPRLVKKPSQPQAFQAGYFLMGFTTPPPNWKSPPFLEAALDHGQQNGSLFMILFIFYSTLLHLKSKSQIPNSIQHR